MIISIEKLKKLFGENRSVIEVYKSCKIDENNRTLDCLIDYCTGIQISEEIPSDLMKEMEEQWKRDADIYIIEKHGLESDIILYIPKLECVKFSEMLSCPSLEIKIYGLDENARFSVHGYEKFLSNATIKHAFLEWIIYQRNKAQEQIDAHLKQINTLKETIKKLEENPNLTTEDKLFIEVEGN